MRLLLLFALFSCKIIAQNWNWAKLACNLELSDDPKGIGLDTSGNTYVTVHSHMSYGPSGAYANNYYFLYKLDNHGDILWQDTIPGYITKSVTGKDGNTYVAGSNVVSKYDGNGNKLWSKIISDNSWVLNMELMPSGGVVCRNHVIVAGVWKTHLIRIDANGTKIWDELLEISVESSNMVAPLCVDRAGSIYLAGAKNSSGTYLRRLIKLDEYGQTVSEFQINDNSVNLAVGGDSTIYLINELFTLQSQPLSYISKYNYHGNLIWRDTLFSKLGEITQIKNTADGDVYISGFFLKEMKFKSVEYLSEYASMFIARLDGNGHTIWLKQTGSDWGWIYPASFAFTNEKDIVVMGNMNSTHSFDDIVVTSHDTYDDMYVAKLGTSSNVSGLPVTANLKSGTTVYPIPTSRFIQINGIRKESSQTKIKIESYIGEVLYTGAFSDKNEQILDLGFLVRGIYYIELDNEYQHIRKKIILD